jgi:excisionase family DNA binding protein
MTDYYTTKQVQDLLKVDRITIYRMLQDGRLRGVKIGQQWRFAQREVERLLSGAPVADEALAPSGADSGFPTHCVQTIQDLFSDVSQIGALVVDKTGRPITQVSGACAFCQQWLQNPAGQAACQQTWREVAQQGAGGRRFFTCHAGLQYIAAAIGDPAEPAGYFLAGQFHWQTPEPREQAERLRRAAGQVELTPAAFQQAAENIPVIAPDQHAQVEAWPQSAARAIESILRERIGLIQRLQQIANLTQIP